MAWLCHNHGMPRARISTTVDPQLLAQARALAPEESDATMVERALTALLGQHRRTRIDGDYEQAYRRHPLDDPDEWGDLRSFGEAVRS